MRIDSIMILVSAKAKVSVCLFAAVRPNNTER